ncbi:MAG: polysaccharide biosynthesis protein [Selenomonadales bacterium]|nr:polysaccharide biosynthesis protein [Selenomonadales bacterium]
MSNMKNKIGQLYYVLFDAAVLSIVPFIALLLRLDGDTSSNYFDVLLNVVLLGVIIKVAVFLFYGVYNRIWRYATIKDMFAIIGACTIGGVIVALLGLCLEVKLPRSIYIISYILDVGMICFSRLVVRMLLLMNQRDGDAPENSLVIIGAGDAGAMIAREMIQRGEGKKLLGFLDDDDAKVGKRILGYPVLGTSDDIAEIAGQNDIKEIVIAMPSVKGSIIRGIADKCKQTGCKVKVLPGIYELIDGKVSMQQLRNIDIEDLLRRDSIQLDMQAISEYIEGKTVLVTGAGGSIGSELCRQISKARPEKLLLLGRGENSIYEIHQELIERFGPDMYIPIIADIRDEDRLETVFSRYKPQLVFHAAAHKHVPLMEAQPEEAVKNNIFGTRNVALAADRHGAEAFVMISTDKAVNPTSVMGATKRIAELVVQDINKRSKTMYAIVRFGNVLGSRGSVVPLFKKQIAKGGPITITDPEMVRYFMTIPEAAQLVLQAGTFSKGGEVFLLDMGEPVKILDMARDLVSLHGLVPDKDIKFVFTGLRPGEKLYEELLTAEEGTQKTTHDRIFQAPIVEEVTEETIKLINGLQGEKDTKNILMTIKELIPTFNSKRLKEMN